MIDLPPEIIEIIFLMLCSPKTVFPLRDDPRLLVTHVCSQWRAIALAMSRLWANIRIPLNFPLPYDHVRAWITGSAQSPLIMGFYGPVCYDTSSASIFDLIVPVIQRCTSLRLSLDESTLERLLTLPLGSLCALQNISISSVPKYGGTIYFPPYRRVTAFRQCPQLRQVSFAFQVHTIDPTVFDLPWRQLTQLNMSSFSLREYECLNILRQCTALQECSISTFPFDNLQGIEVLSAHPIVVPSLHTLHLGLGDPMGDSVHFVRALRLPRLRSFRFLLPASRVLHIFEPLLSKTVRHLDVARATEDLPAVLRLVPNLETLKVRGTYLTSSEVLRALSGGAVVPRLVALNLNKVDSCDLFDMLDARAAAARANSNVTMFSDVSAVDSGDEDIDPARLEVLRAAGMRVVFRRRLF